jgi:2-dehydro-3-deoxyglucarate aldolase/4-hydroxy-2-oxoheptanedioate aldolase
MEVIAKFRERLNAGDICLGASITLADPLVSDALGDSADFLWIDMEHSPMSPGVLQCHLLAARARAVPALVRVTGSDTAFIKPALDAGAEAIIVPQVRSAEEVRQIVSDCHYPPVGTRGYGPRVPSNYGRDGGAEYVKRANANVFVAVQIENMEGLEALDEILAIEGLDSVVIGPNDLSGSMGRLGDLDHPEVVAAMQTIIDKTRAAGLIIGAGMGISLDFACVMIERGIQWLQLGGDVEYLVESMDRVTASVRDRLARKR